MLIKNVIRKGPGKGTPILYTPEEAATFAVQRGVKKLNSKEKIFWVLKESIKIDEHSSHQSSPDSYEAWASGTASIGYTEVATDRFYVPKEHSFTVRYKSAHDSHGVPDIEVVDFQIDATAKNLQEAAPKVAAAPKAELLPKGVKIRKPISADEE